MKKNAKPFDTLMEELVEEAKIRILLEELKKDVVEIARPPMKEVVNYFLEFPTYESLYKNKKTASTNEDKLLYLETEIKRLEGLKASVLEDIRKEKERKNCKHEWEEFKGVGNSDVRYVSPKLKEMANGFYRVCKKCGKREETKRTKIVPIWE